MNKQEEYFELVGTMEKLRERKSELANEWNEKVAWSESQAERDAHENIEKEIQERIERLELDMRVKRSNFTKDELRSMAKEWRETGEERKKTIYVQL